MSTMHMYDFEAAEASRKVRAQERLAMMTGETVRRLEHEVAMGRCTTAEVQAELERLGDIWMAPLTHHDPFIRYERTDEERHADEMVDYEGLTDVVSMDPKTGALRHVGINLTADREAGERFDPWWDERPYDPEAVSVKVQSDEWDESLPADVLAEDALEDRLAARYALDRDLPLAGKVTVSKGNRSWLRPAQEATLLPHETLRDMRPSEDTIPEGSHAETLYSESVMASTAWAVLGVRRTTHKSGQEVLSLGTMSVAQAADGSILADCGKCGKQARYTDADARQRMLNAWHGTLASLSEDDPERGEKALEAAYKARHDYQGRFTAYFIVHGYQCQYEAQKARPSGYARTVESDGTIRFHCTDRFTGGTEAQPALPNLGEEGPREVGRPIIGAEWSLVMSDAPTLDLSLVRTVESFEVRPAKTAVHNPWA